METWNFLGDKYFLAGIDFTSIAKSIANRWRRRARESGFLCDCSTAAWVRALAAVLCLTGASLGVALAQEITPFGVALPTGSTLGITAGPDGNLWFVKGELANNIARQMIGRITPSGVFLAEFDPGMPLHSLSGIATGPDGNVWYTGATLPTGDEQIGRITPTGVVTIFSAGISTNANLRGIAPGPDGNLWFTEQDGNRIGRITPTGVVTEFSSGISGTRLHSITAGPDGNLWFIEAGSGLGDARIGRITPTGLVTEFSARVEASEGNYGITTGPDGNVWFTAAGGLIGRITPAGAVTEFSTGNASGRSLLAITAGPDGNLWFTETGDVIGRITPTGVVTEFSTGITLLDGPNVAALTGIAAGPDGNIWAVDAYGPILRIAVAATANAQLSSSLVDFGNQVLGTTSTSRSLTLTNSGSANLVVNTVSIAGANPTDFSVANNGCVGVVITPSNACTVATTFTPTQLGGRSATLTFFSNSNGSIITASLQGSGTSIFGANPPAVRAISPTAGLGGTAVTIRGRGFGKSQGVGYVRFGDVIAQTTSWSDTQILGVAPAGLTYAVPVTVTTIAGISNSNYLFTYPTTTALNIVAVPPLKGRQDFGLFRPSSSQPELAFVSVASNQQQDLNLQDLCYGGAMDAAAVVQRRAIIEESFNRFVGDIVKASLGVVDTGTVLGNYLLKVGTDAAGAALAGQPIAQQVAISVTNSAGGYIVSKAAGGYMAGAGSLLADLTRQSVINALAPEDVLPWLLSGTNAGSPYVASGLRPPTSINAKVYYHPWTHYTTAVIGATCQLSSGTKRMIYVVTYEQSKSPFGSAEPIYSTLSHQSIDAN